MAANQFCQNLTVYQGDDWAALVTVLNPDGTTPDLTGYTAQSQIRAGIADQSWGYTGLTCAVVLPNQISISLTNAQTTLLTQPTYCWDLQLTSPGGIITTIMAGQVNMIPEVTRSWVPAPVPAQALLWVTGPQRLGLYWLND